MLSDEEISSIARRYRIASDRLGAISLFARAIESAVLPEGLVAVSVATLQKRRDDSYSCKLLCDDLLAAAPKPAQAEKQEPVKDEPVAWIDGGDLREVCNGNSRYVHCDNQGRMVPLYTRPQPDLTAEVERLKLSAEHWNRLYREKCQEFHDAQANKGQEIVWLIDRIATLEEAAREARGAFEQHDGNYKLSKASGAVVEAAIAKLDAVLGNA